MPFYPISFNDLEFAERTVPCHYRYEGASHRRIPYGMPWIPQHLKDVAFFLYGKTSKGELKARPTGTGFLVGALIPSEKEHPWNYHVYAVTCWHVAVDGLASNIRLKTKKGESRLIEFEPEQWEFISGGADLAAVDLTDRLPEADEFFIVPERQFGNKNFLMDQQVGIGEDGFMLGLFVGNPGKDRNLVAARFGNVSLLASNDAPIKQENGSIRPAHLFDMRSRGGFSGSPVFIYRTPNDDLRSLATPETARNNNGLHIRVEAQKEQHLALLGVHAGQYPEPAIAKKAKKKTRESDNLIVAGDELELPSGMTIVIPSWEIIDLLNKPVFTKQRVERQKLRSERADEEINPLPEVAAAEKAEPETDNPSHKEDFTSLLNAVVKARRPKRRT